MVEHYRLVCGVWHWLDLRSNCSVWRILLSLSNWGRMLLIIYMATTVYCLLKALLRPNASRETCQGQQLLFHGLPWQPLHISRAPAIVYPFVWWSSTRVGQVLAEPFWATRLSFENSERTSTELSHTHVKFHWWNWQPEHKPAVASDRGGAQTKHVVLTS